jgi:hypothetical protein
MRPIVEDRRCSIAEILILLEAAVCLLAARFALASLSYRHLTRLFTKRPRTPELIDEERRQVREKVQTALEGSLIWLPFRTTCFHRAIAAQAMLRHRNIGSTLCYGAVTSSDRRLQTHVWLQDGTEGIVGHLVAERDGYHILARYPETPYFATKTH